MATEDPQQTRLDSCERRAEAILRVVKEMRDYIRSLEMQLKQIQGGS